MKKPYASTKQNVREEDSQSHANSRSCNRFGCEDRLSQLLHKIAAHYTHRKLPNNQPEDTKQPSALKPLVLRSRHRQIVAYLKNREAGPSSISRACGIPTATATRHLRALYDHGYVNKTDEATATKYFLTPKGGNL